jgi:hypothetical protein
VTEAELDAAVVQICDDLDLIILHVREPRRERGDWPGFPDRMIFSPSPPYVLYRELKAATGLSGQQKRWRWRLAEQCRQDYDTWRERDLRSGRIAAELAALAGQGADPGDGAHDPERAFFIALHVRRH